MMSHTSVLAPWEAPEQDIIAMTGRQKGIFGCIEAGNFVPASSIFTAEIGAEKTQ